MTIRAVRTVAGLFVLVLVTACGADEAVDRVRSATQVVTRVRVMTGNIQQVGAPGERQHEAALQVLARIRPDVLAVRTRSSTPSRARRSASRRSRAACRRPGGSGPTSGLACCRKGCATIPSTT